MNTIKILCDHCYQRFPVAKEVPRIIRWSSGGLGFMRVITVCPHCGKETRVPQTKETQELLKDRLT